MLRSNTQGVSLNIMKINITVYVALLNSQISGQAPITPSTRRSFIDSNLHVLYSVTNLSCTDALKSEYSHPVYGSNVAVS